MVLRSLSWTRITTIAVLVLSFLFFLNSLIGGRINLLWMYYPELDNDNIWSKNDKPLQDVKNHQRGRDNQAVKKLNNLYKPLQESSKDGRNGHDGISVQFKTETIVDISKIKVPFKSELKSSSQQPQCDIEIPAEKFDCFPEVANAEYGCLMRGCCWGVDKARQKPLRSTNSNATLSPADVPFCYYPRNYPSYSVDSINYTKYGFSLKLSGEPPAFYPGGVKQLTVDVFYETEKRLHVKIYDAKNKRYEVPLDVPKFDGKAANAAYTVTTSEQGSPFWMAVTRNSDNTVVFSTKGTAPLIFTDQFLQLSSRLPSNYIYGLGEHRSSLLLDMNWTRRTMWNRDNPPEEDQNLYGSHPYYLMMESAGRASGFFLMNSNAMDVTLQPLPAITWRTIGGILDFYIFIGQNPDDVTREYTNVIGRTFMPPYWSLGFHICRFGLKDVTDTMAVVDRVRKYRIPQDIQWNDIDYAIGKKDFTTDVERFGDQAGMVQELHNRGMKYIIIVDPGISSTQPPGSYRPYDLGVEMDIFIKNETNQLYIGAVWPGPTVFPDFSYFKATEYWSTLIKEFWMKVPVDGLWIDMDEIAQFIDGSVNGCEYNRYNNPPYIPDVVGGMLYSRTACPSARQKYWPHYDLHNMYGMMETNATYHALKALPEGKRPFVISRSTFAGQGHYGGHWTGDNFPTYHDLNRSISAILSMNLFGIPMVGADICGFQPETTYQLCLRWYQLGAFYPFSRSHNSDLSKVDHDPGAFDAFFGAAVRDVYRTRYSLLPYLYTLFHESYINGTAVARAMFYEFPYQEETYAIDWQFMWGSGLLIAPVVTENATSVDVYLPVGSVWYNYYSGEKYYGKGNNITLPAPLNVINLLVQGGSILPMQEPALTTTESRLNDFSLLVAMGTNGTAQGSLFWDDGSTQDSLDSENYNLVSFTLQENKLRSHVLRGRYVNKIVKNMTIYGVDSAPSSVKMNGSNQTFKYNPDFKVLKIPSFEPIVTLLQEFLLEWL